MCILPQRLNLRIRKVVMKMKPSLKSLIVNTLAVCVMLLTALNVQAQEGKYDFPTDRAELPYNVLEMVELIQTAYEAPVESNAYVQMVANAEGFPALELGQTLSKAQVKKVTKWVETNPAVIEQLLIARKKNHDLYFNPETKGASK